MFTADVLSVMGDKVALYPEMMKNEVWYPCTPGWLLCCEILTDGLQIFEHITEDDELRAEIVIQVVKQLHKNPSKVSSTVR